MGRRRFELIATAGMVHVSVDGELTEETFDLSPPRELIYYLRSANLSSAEVERILSELSTAGSSTFSA